MILKDSKEVYMEEFAGRKENYNSNSSQTLDIYSFALSDPCIAGWYNYFKC